MTKLLVVVNEAGEDIVHLCNDIKQVNKVIEDVIEDFWDIDKDTPDKELNSFITIYRVSETISIVGGKVNDQRSE